MVDTAISGIGGRKLGELKLEPRLGADQSGHLAEVVNAM